jgi:hypothetical protein
MVLGLPSAYELMEEQSHHELKESLIIIVNHACEQVQANDEISNVSQRKCTYPQTIHHHTFPSHQ